VNIIAGWIRETRLNFRYEMLSFLLHRISGLGVVVFVLVHLYSLAQRLASPDKFNSTMLLYDNQLFHIGEWALFIGCCFHAFNGFRIMLVDFFPLTRNQREYIFWVVGLCAVFAAFGALFFFPELRTAILA